MNKAEALTALRHYFGYNSFRPGQAEVIESVLAGRDALAVMPTGAGKSICYQLPAVMLPGLVLVVSPLVSLMGDQVRSLIEAGIRGSYLNSTLNLRQQEIVMERAQSGAYDVMYVAPERLRDERFRLFCQHLSIPFIAVDEAHCVSQWGQDFRPSYLGIADFVAALPKRPPLIALTATATKRVQDDIVRMLDLHNPFRLVTGFDRPNLYYAVARVAAKDKLKRLIARIAAHKNESGIIYCSTRKTTDEVYEALAERGVCVTRYHAGLLKEERLRNQAAFINDDAPVMVATNAFGMGIDKSNVRYVIHYNLPGSLEAYYQEAGRAGRDGEAAECLLFWNDSDIATCRYFIESDVEQETLSEEEREAVRQIQRRLLSIMTGYCLTTECLRAYILSYFGETLNRVGKGAFYCGEHAQEKSVHAAHCKNCSNCLEDVQAIDVTETALGILRCVQELRGRFGKTTVVDVVRGADNKHIREYELNQKKYYNTLDVPAGQLKEVIELLASQGYVEISEGRYPLVGLGPRAREAAEPGFVLRMKQVRPQKRNAVGGSALSYGAAGTSRSSQGAFGQNLRVAEGQASDKELFERLRVLRKSLAVEFAVPPYIIFSDAALRDMCVKRPTTDEEFLEVKGVGEAKLRSYGPQFLAEIAKG